MAFSSDVVIMNAVLRRTRELGKLSQTHLMEMYVSWSQIVPGAIVALRVRRRSVMLSVIPATTADTLAG